MMTADRRRSSGAVMCDAVASAASKRSPPALNSVYAVVSMTDRLQTPLQLSTSFVGSWKLLAESLQSSLPSQTMSALISGGRLR